MNRTRSILGLLCLSGLCFCAFGAANASAMTMHECKEKPVEGEVTAQEYTTSTCQTKGPGNFKTVSVGNSAVNLTPSAVEKFTLSAAIGGIKFKLTCAKLTGSGEATNKTILEKMQIAGSKIILIFTECTVDEPAGKGCVVTEPIVTNEATSATSEDKTTYTPVNAEKKFTTITISGCKEAAAPLNGPKDVTGTATGVNEPATPTVQEFTATSGSALKLAGQTATLLGKATSVTKGTAVGVSLETP